MPLHPYNKFLSLLDTAPDDLLVIQGDRRITRFELGELAGGIARELDHLGVHPKDGEAQARVLIRLPNSPEMMALVLAVWAQGGLPMLLSTRAPDTHLKNVEALHSPMLVVDEESLDALIGDPCKLPIRVIPEDQDASVVFTSGSTGRPKGVVQKAATLTTSTIRVSEYLGYDACERILVPIPMSHDYGWNQMLAGLVCGHNIVLPKTSALIDVSRTINQHRPTVISGVPSLYTSLLMGISGFEKVDTSSIKLLVSTGSIFPDRLYQTLSERVPDARILLNYGLTETFRSCCLKPEDPRGEGNNLGRPIKEVAIMIVDADGCEVPRNTEGEIVHIGAGAFDRYLDDPDKTAKIRRTVSESPAVATGDWGYLDDAGYVYFTARRDRLVKSMDTNVSLDEVESILETLDGVEEVAVIAQANHLTGVDLVAYCTHQEAIPLADIRKSASHALPAFMLPRRWVTGPSFPRTPVGKTDYPAVAKLCEASSS